MPICVRDVWPVLVPVHLQTTRLTTVRGAEMKGAWQSDWQQAADEKQALQEELAQIRAAYEFVLPYLHVDIRAQALAIYEPKPTPLENYIGSLRSEESRG